ncbi:MAG: hypothetical protein V2A76_15985 [Planctomycetota bacterium]
MGRAWVFVAPCALMCLLLSDQAAKRVLERGAETRFAREHEEHAASGFLPALRALLVQIWMVRIDADLRAGRPHLALRHGREMLQMAPGVARTRIRLADLLAYRMAPLESEPDRQMAWIGEGLAILDEGLEGDPTCPEYHTERGLLIWSRGEVCPEFAAAFRAAHGVTVMEAGVEALVRGAEVSRGNWWAVRAASVGLQQRGDDYLERSVAEEGEFLPHARDDYRRASGYLRELLQFSDFAQDALKVDLALAEVCEQQVLFLTGRAAGRDAAPLLAAVRKARAVFQAGSAELPVGTVRLATVLADLLAPLAGDPAQREALRAEAVEILVEGLAREPDSRPLLEALSRLRR